MSHSGSIWRKSRGKGIDLSLTAEQNKHLQEQAQKTSVGSNCQKWHDRSTGSADMQLMVYQNLIYGKPAQHEDTNILSPFA